MIILHIRMAREESPLGKFLLLRVQHALYSEYQRDLDEDDDDYVEDYDELEVWLEALSRLLTSSFVPFGRSGRVTHAKVIG